MQHTQRGHIPGGLVLAVDAESGKVRWLFNTIPQDANHQGWEIAGPTWVGGERNGGGIWETAAIDPQLGMGMVYMALGNPFGDSTQRAGTTQLAQKVREMLSTRSAETQM
jgi:glucose dehydrogenase